MMDLLHDSNVWLVFSFVIFLFVLWKFRRKAFVGLLDRRIEDIREEIATAENLRIEAQELLAQYQRKHRDAVKDSEQIIADAEKRAAEITKAAEKELADVMARREKQLEERLARMEQAAIIEIQKYAADLAIKATAEIISDQLDKKSNDKLVDQSIKDLSENIH